MAASDSIERRAAFDIGSGSTKLQVSDVLLCAGTTGEIIRTLYSVERPCAFGIDWKRSTNNSLSDEIQAQGLAILAELKEIAVRQHSCSKLAAVATEVFRKAQNGPAYLERVVSDLGIPVKLVTQDLEAELGYSSVISIYSANASSSSTSSSKLNIPVWDSGGASFQITTMADQQMSIYKGALGTSVALTSLVEEVKGQKLRDIVGSANPVSVSDANSLIDCLKAKLDPVPEWLLGSPQVLSAAGTNSIFKLCCDILRIAGFKGNLAVGEFSAEDARAALSLCVELSDAQLQKYQDFPFAEGTHVIVPKLCLLCAVIEHARFQSVKIVEVTGSCPGVIIADKYYMA